MLLEQLLSIKHVLYIPVQSGCALSGSDAAACTRTNEGTRPLLMVLLLELKCRVWHGLLCNCFDNITSVL
jgi:hypothetical protein